MVAFDEQRERFHNVAAMQMYSGIAPLTERSGKKSWVHWRCADAVAASHLRVGTFQFFAARGDLDMLRRLADYAIARHAPALAGAPERIFGLLEAVVRRQATPVSQWMNVGFIHGVMDTDNMTISGETIDYGP